MMVRLRYVLCLMVAINGWFIPFLTHADTPKQAVWIDADPACGQSVWQDVDDCYALVYALGLPQLQVRGISVVFGNGQGLVPLNTARRVLTLLRDTTPLFLGYQRPFTNLESLKQLKNDNNFPDAVYGLAEALKTGSMTILALGPLTNIAATLHVYPELRSQVKEVVMLGGLLPGEDYWISPAGRLVMRDFNVIKDPVATAYLLSTGVKVRFVPVVAAFDALMRQEDLDELIGDKRFDWLVQESAAWMRYWTIGFGTDGFPPFDTLAVLLTVAPQWFDCTPVKANMKTRRLLGMTQEDVLELAPSSNEAAYARCMLKRTTATATLGRRFGTARSATDASARPSWRTILTDPTSVSIQQKPTTH